MSGTHHEMGQGEGTLVAASVAVAGAGRDLEHLSRDLDSRIRDLGGRWVGAGGSAFLRLHGEWVGTHGRLVKALDAFEQSLRSTERDNTSTDEAQASPLTTLASRLG